MSTTARPHKKARLREKVKPVLMLLQMLLHLPNPMLRTKQKTKLGFPGSVRRIVSRFWSSSFEGFWHRLAIPSRLRSVREHIAPVLEQKLGRNPTLVQKIDVLLRGGRPRPFALVGASGTGKSFRALLFAEHHNIPYLIDDGILIEGGRIVAGRSAKNDAVYVKAIKTALFDQPEHLAEVRKAMKENQVKRILLVGTSLKMVRMIAERLRLPRIAESDITYIEEIASPDEIEKARASRGAGHHIIPVPAVEVSREYGHLLRDGFQVFLSDLRMGMKHYLKKIYRRHKGSKDKVFEKTVVKPEFMHKKLDASPKTNQIGRIQIAENALRQMIVHCIDEYNQDLLVERIKIRISRNSYKVKVFITLPLGMFDVWAAEPPNQSNGNTKELNSYLYKLQNYVINSLHRYAGVLLEEFSIEVSQFT